MVRLLAVVVTLVTLGACGTVEPARSRLRDRDALCTDRAKPLAYGYAVPDEAYRAGCFDVRVHQSTTDPRTGRQEHWEDLVFCCPR